MRAAVLALALIVAACGNSPVGQAPSPASQSGSPLSSTPTIKWQAISVDDSDTFGIDISGTGSGVSKVEIHSRYGTVSLGGRNVAALVYKKIPWNGYSLILYQALAVEAHSWTVFWFYCTGSSLTYVYWESTASSIVSKAPMKGSCTSTATANATLSWPAVSMSAPAAVPGFRAHGALLDIGSAAPGHAAFDGRSWTLYPYAVVDCSKICGSPGWYELHALLWDRQTSEAAYGIFYLITGQPHQVQLEYSLELPTLGRPANASFEADWTRTP